jgi:nicotinate phosphoribosyltransferase
LAVAWALYELGYKPVGIRLDSGDLAYLSRKTKEMYTETAIVTGIEAFQHLQIVASNDINESVLLSLNREGHEITTFGIGTHLVTCQSQPALGCVYKVCLAFYIDWSLNKRCPSFTTTCLTNYFNHFFAVRCRQLVEVGGQPRIKLSQDVEKLVIPCCKNIYRLIGVSGQPLIDIMTMADEPAPVPGERILCRHPFLENKRAYVTPTKVIPMLNVIWSGSVETSPPLQPLEVSRTHCREQIAAMRTDHTRPLNPTPYKVSGKN